MKMSDLYKKKLITIPDAVSQVRSNHTIGVGMAASEPPGLLGELGNHKGRLENVTVWVCLPLRQYDFVLRPEMAGHFFVENWFYGAPDRNAHPEGRTSYIPNNLHAAASSKLESTGNHLDIFWGTATPPDERGYMSLSTSLVIEKLLMDAADLVVLEINENLPWTLGDTHVHISDVDYLVENHVPVFELQPAPAREWENAIGGYVAELIEDGATLQLGIGGIPNAITAFLKERRDLGVHTEMFIDGMVDLYEAGVITGKKKSMYPGKMVGAFALGTQKLYDFVDHNLGVEFLQGNITNDPYVLAQNYKMISVNTALQVDVYGQVCSQSIGPRHYSGTGGQLDTHRGAQMSPLGRGIIALPSTAKKGTIPTIVPMLAEGAEVTVPSQDVDTIVTEYGIAELKGKSVKDRLAALQAISHPDYRDWLGAETERLGIVPRLQVSGFEIQKSKLPASAPGVSADTIKLGSFCDLSGPNAGIGTSAYRGYSTYYDYVNRWGGVNGRKIELIVEDDRFDPQKSLQAVRKLVEKDEVFAIVSPLGTPTNLVVRDYLLKKEIPVISPHSGLSTWAEPLEKYYFALQPSYEVEGRIMAQYVQRSMKFKRVAVFAIDDHFGNEGSQAFCCELERLGLEPVKVVRHSTQESYEPSWLKRLQAVQPDLIMLYTYTKAASDLLRAAVEANFKPSWLGSYVLSGAAIMQSAGKDATHGMRVSSYPTGPRHHRGERLYRKMLSRKFGEFEPDTHSRIGYSAAQLVVEGLRRAGSDLNREAFILALEGLDQWTGGLLPPISYSGTDHRGLTALAIQLAVRGVWLREQNLVRLAE